MDPRETNSKEGQVTAQITKQEDALGALSDTIGRLEKHLSAFLLLPSNVKDVVEPEQELVPLAVRIRENLCRIGEQDARLKDIIARLET